MISWLVTLKCSEDSTWSKRNSRVSSDNFEVNNFQCECDAGFKEENGDCVDIDECTDGSAQCNNLNQHDCVNIAGGYHCACDHGKIFCFSFYYFFILFFSKKVCFLLKLDLT